VGDYSREVGSAPRIPAAPVEDTSLQEFRQQIETNLFGTIIMTKALLGHFREQRAGVILRISSIAGRVGPTGRAPYAAAKFGVEGFSEALARDVGPLGIKVVIVEPGGFRTDFAGSSTNLYARHPEYSETVGATVISNRTSTENSPAIRKRRLNFFCALLRLINLPFESSWAATPTRQPNKLIPNVSNLAGGSRIGAAPQILTIKAVTRFSIASREWCCVGTFRLTVSQAFRNGYS
jgi:NAD(P)-dependent dehydrogenase (short-subunit alcohol dehydrogenase family)